MQKIQVFLRDDQKTALKTIAARTVQKRSDLIRNGIDLLIQRAELEDVQWRETTRTVAGMWKDRTDLEAFSREFRSTAARRFQSVRKQR